MISPNEPAMPTTGIEYVNRTDPDTTVGVSGGLSIRAELAARAMQALLSIYDADGVNPISPNYENAIYMASLAVKCADALISELNKTEKS